MHKGLSQLQSKALCQKACGEALALRACTEPQTEFRTHSLRGFSMPMTLGPRNRKSNFCCCNSPFFFKMAMHS